LNSVNAKTLNIAGNGIYTMKQYSQEQIDDFTYKLLKAVLESPELNTKIDSIRSGGQSGFDEAGAKAGYKLGIKTLVLAPKGYTFRDVNSKDISNEKLFKDRFNIIEESKEELPSSDMSTISSLPTSNDTINIYAGANQYKELSNFAIRPFTVNVELPQGEKQFTFQSVEQGFHFYKALAAGNGIIGAKILKTTNGAELRKLTNRSSLPMTAEQVEEWDNTSKSIMLNLMYDSYAQNPQEASKLLDTGDAKITHNQDNTRWKLDFPEIVMTVRDMLREEGFTPSTVIPETTENIPTESLEDTNEEQVDFVGKNDNIETIVEGELSVVDEVIAQELITKQSPIIKLPRSERDVVKPSQVLMPWKFKAKMSKYIKNGKLDMSKIDPKILIGFGMRIPNQGPNSQVAFEIVGFLPKEAGDQIIASKDLVTQMGHDFDFDTMYTYLYDSVEVNGVLTPITSEIETRILNEFGVTERNKKVLIEQINSKREQLAELRELKELTYGTAQVTREYERFTKKTLKESSKALFEELKQYKELSEIVKGDLDKLLLLQSILNSPDAALKNELVDTHIAVHNNPSSEVQKQIKRPIGSWILADYAKQMDKVVGERKDRELQRIKAINEEIIKENTTSKNKKPLVPLPVGISPMSDLSQTTKFVSGTAGNAGVGVYSLYNTFLSVMAQKEGTNPDEQIIYKTRASQGKKGLKDWYINIGGTRSNGRLCSPYTIDCPTLVAVIPNACSVAVKNFLIAGSL